MLQNDISIVSGFEFLIDNLNLGLFNSGPILRRDTL